MIFPCIKNANTKIQIHKYTNIAYDKVPERPRCKTRKYTLTLFVYSCICISAFACQTPGNIVFKSSCHYLFKICHMLGLFSNLTQTVFVYLDVRHSGTLFLRSSYHLPFKNISYHGSFQGFPAPELCDANKWDGWLDGTKRAKLKEFTTFAVPRSVLPELQISFFPH